jgi:hypothetical protein
VSIAKEWRDVFRFGALVGTLSTVGLAVMLAEPLPNGRGDALTILMGLVVIVTWVIDLHAYRCYLYWRQREASE